MTLVERYGADPVAERLWTPATVITFVRTIASLAVAALAHRTGEDPANLRVAEETHEFFEFVELTEIPTLNLLRCEKHRDTYQTEITVNQGGAVKARSRFTFI